MASNLLLRGHNYYFRARIPLHLVAEFGRTHVRLSLHTADKDEARRRAREHRVSLERELAVLQAKQPGPDQELSGSVLHLSDSDIDAVCERYRIGKLGQDELARIKGLTAESVELEAEIIELGMPAMRLAYACGDLKEVYPSLQEHLKKLGLHVARQSPAYERLARRFQQAELEVHDALLKRSKGVAVDIPLAATDFLSINDVYKCWLRRKPQNPKTVRSFECAFNEFRNHCLAPTASMVKKADVVSFRNALSDRGELSPATICKQLGFLRAAFQCAVDDDLLESNPFIGVRVVVPKKKSAKTRLPFALSELQTLFNGPVYQPGYEPRAGLGSACYWLPLMALFSGARLEELAQLRGSDFQEEKGLGHYIQIRDSEDNDQEVKNRNSVRNLPVHPTLVALGLLAYVKRCKGGMLFPTLRADKYGILSTTFSTWFGRHRDALGIKDPSRVFHSFRHNFVDVCKQRAAQIPPEVREAMVGHLSANQIEQVYGSGLYPLEPQFAAMKHVDYAGLDLGHLMAP
jgi:integrase